MSKSIEREMATKKHTQTKAVTRTDPSHRAYLEIKKMLLYNEISPGQKIISRDLAKQLGMSPTPVIQALKLLEHGGMLRHEPNKGYYTGQLSLKEIREIYDLRAIVEVSLLPETIKIVDKKGIERLKAALDAHLVAEQDIYLNDRLIKDMEYHLVLASLSGLEVHQRFLMQLFDLLYIKYRVSLLFTTALKSVENEHKKIYDCVASRDLEASKKTLLRHILNVKDYVLVGVERMLKSKETS